MWSTSYPVEEMFPANVQILTSILSLYFTLTFNYILHLTLFSTCLTTCINGVLERVLSLKELDWALALELSLLLYKSG